MLISILLFLIRFGEKLNQKISQFLKIFQSNFFDNSEKQNYSSFLYSLSKCYGNISYTFLKGIISEAYEYDYLMLMCILLALEVVFIFGLFDQTSVGKSPIFELITLDEINDYMAQADSQKQKYKIIIKNIQDKLDVLENLNVWKTWGKRKKNQKDGTLYLLKFINRFYNEYTNIY